MTLAVAVGIAAGVYPALFLSAFQPVEVWRGPTRCIQHEHQQIDQPATEVLIGEGLHQVEDVGC